MRPAASEPGRRSTLVGAIAAAAGTLAFFWPLLVGQTFSTVAGHQRGVYPWFSADSPYRDANQSDQATLNYPWQAFLTRSLRSADPPLWNPLSFGGQPFLGNGSSGIAYPPRLLGALLLSPSGAHDLLCVVHVFGAGLAMFLLCRRLGAGNAASVLAATSWMFASFNMAWLHLEVVSPVMILLPSSLLLVRRAVEAPSLAGVAGAAFVTGLTVVSGHLLLMAAVWTIAIGYGLWCLVAVALAAPREARGRETARAGARLAVVAAGGLALFACVVLPTAATIAGSHRKALTYEQARVVARSEPRAFLNVFRPPPVPALYDDRPMNREMTFAGTAAGVLAIIGFFRRGPASALGRTLAVGVALLALDTPLLPLAYRLVPGLTLVLPLGRLFFVWDLAIALLAAAGLDGLMAAAGSWPSRWPGARARRAAFVLQKVAVPAIVLVNTVQLLAYGRALNPPFHPRRPELLYPRTPLIAAARAHVRRFDGRIVAVEAHGAPTAGSPGCLVAGQHMVFGLPSLGGYDSVIPRRALYVGLVVSGGLGVEDVLRDPPLSAHLARFRVDSTRFELLPRLGVTAIVGPPGTRRAPLWSSRTQPLRLEQWYAARDGQLFGIADAPGEAWVVPAAIVVDSAGDALRRLAAPDFDFRRAVILERSDAPWAGSAVQRPAPGAMPDEARIERKTNNRLSVRIRSSEGGWLVVADTWDAGWRATVDERPAPLFQANYAFRAVQVPAGEHRVEMRYRPVGFVPGLFISASALLAGVAAALMRVRRRPGPAD